MQIVHGANDDTQQSQPFVGQYAERGHPRRIIPPPARQEDDAEADDKPDEVEPQKIRPAHRI